MTPSVPAKMTASGACSWTRRASSPSVIGAPGGGGGGGPAGAGGGGARGLGRGLSLPSRGPVSRSARRRGPASDDAVGLQLGEILGAQREPFLVDLRVVLAQERRRPDLGGRFRQLHRVARHR